LLDTKLQFRLFREEDLTEVVDINRKCLPENYPPFFFLDLHMSFPKTFLVAEVENKIAGYVMCRIESGLSDFHPGRIVQKGHVVSIAVLPEYRRKGIGRSLMVASLNGMLDYKATESFLEVRVSNYPAISLYKELGFIIARKISKYYHDGEDAYVMALDLLEKKFSNEHLKAI
jgi:ribosomal-protein-alanine N-acetyltransferase